MICKHLIDWPSRWWKHSATHHLFSSCQVVFQCAMHGELWFLGEGFTPKHLQSISGWVWLGKNKTKQKYLLFSHIMGLEKSSQVQLLCGNSCDCLSVTQIWHLVLHHLNGKSVGWEKKVLEYKCSGRLWWGWECLARWKELLPML